MTVLSIGEPLLEFNAATDGDLRSAQEFQVGFGGDTSNFSVAACRSGVESRYLTRIGDDEFGQVLLRLWEREGVGTEHVVCEAGGRTGIYFISRGVNRTSFTYYRSDSPASRLSPDDVTETAVFGASVVHVTGITQAISTSACDAVFHAIEIARRHGRLVSYDPNHRPALWSTARARGIVMRSVELADLVFPNIEEGRVLTGLEDPYDVLAAFADRGPRVVVLKMGEQGALLWSGQDVQHVPAHPVRAVDSSGAGDTFDGAFVARFEAGDGPVAAARYAAVAAALTTTGFGAVAPIPTAEEVREQLEHSQSALESGEGTSW